MQRWTDLQENSICRGSEWSTDGFCGKELIYRHKDERLTKSEKRTIFCQTIKVFFPTIKSIYKAWIYVAATIS